LLAKRVACPLLRAQQNRRGALQNRCDQKKSAAILIQLDREVALIGDNFNKILKLPDPAYSGRFIELCVCD
jgi:hypothetical protein